MCWKYAKRREWPFLLACIAMVWVWLSPGNARAQAKNLGIARELITIDLVTTLNKLPSDVCIVTDISAEGFEKLDKSQHVDAENNVYDLKKLWNNEKIRPRYSNTIEPQYKAPSQKPCVQTASYCEPKFKLSAEKIPTNSEDKGKHNKMAEAKAGASLDHFILCTNNADQSTANQIAVLRVYGISSTNEDLLTRPFITELKLNKNKLTFNMNSRRSDGATERRFYAVVIGGHYAESEVVTIENRSATLTLTDRCQVHELALPPYAGPAFARVLFSDGSAFKPYGLCTTNVEPNRRFQVVLPYLRGNFRKSITVNTGDSDERDAQSYMGEWYDFTPPPAIALKHNKISFSWRRHCMYPKKAAGKMLNEDVELPRDDMACPEAVLLEGDASPCLWDPDATGCRYTCESSSHTFDLPAHVRFTGNREVQAENDVWEEEIRRGGQVLQGFVPQEQRHVLVDLRDWVSDGWTLNDLIDRKTAGISKISFRGAEGKSFYLIIPKEGARRTTEFRVEQPGAECGQVLTYNILGDQPHSEMTAKIEDGRVRLQPPQKSEQAFDLRVFGGFAYRWPFLVDDVDAKPRANVFGAAGAALQYRPFLRTPRVFDFRASFLFGTQIYFPLRPLTAANAVRKAEKIWYGEFIVDVLCMWAYVIPVGELQLGLGAGEQFGFPLAEADTGRTGEAVFAPSFLGAARLVFNPRWSADGLLRVTLLDNVYAHWSDFQSGALTLTYKAIRIGGELRIGFSL